MKKRFLIEPLMIVFLFTIFSCGENKGSSTATEPTTTDTVAAKGEDAAKKNIEMTKSFYTSFEKGDWAAIEKLVASEITDHSPMYPDGKAKISKDSLITLLKGNKEAFPDMKFEVLNAAADGDYVFVQYRFTGTNSGPMMGQPATNKKVDYTGVDLVRIKDGVAEEHWDYGDNMTFMKQLGMMPEPKSKPAAKKK